MLPGHARRAATPARLADLEARRCDGLVTEAPFRTQCRQSVMWHTDVGHSSEQDESGGRRGTCRHLVRLTREAWDSSWARRMATANAPIDERTLRDDVSLAPVTRTNDTRDRATRGEDMSGNASQKDSLLERICGEFMEMPGLRLTCAQAQRLWGLDEPTCRRVLDALVDARFLVRPATGAYARSTDGMPARSLGPVTFRANDADWLKTSA